MLLVRAGFGGGMAPFRIVEIGLATACPRLRIVLLVPWRQLDWMLIGLALSFVVEP